jgi:hypothetical protein
LERKFERYDKRIIHESKNSALRKNMCDFPRTLGNMSFPDRLERVYPLSVLLADLHDFPKAALADNLEEIERFDRQRFIPSLLKVDLEVERTRAGGGGVPLVRCMLYADKTMSRVCLLVWTRK